jgi:hypothetical protein
MNDQYYVGQRVVCKNDRYHPYISEWCDAFSCNGQVYTIKAVTVCPDTITREIGLGLFFEELNNFTDRFCYSAWRFEPVVLAEVEADELLAVAN